MEELTQLLDDFGESQKEIFRELIEINNEQQRTKKFAVTESDSVEPDERQPNSNNPLEVTTTPINATKDTDRAEPCLTTCPQTEESTPEPWRNDPDIKPTEPVLITRSEEDNRGTRTPAERGEGDDTQLDEPVARNNESPADITPSPVYDER